MRHITAAVIASALFVSPIAMAQEGPEGHTPAQIASYAEPEGQTPAQIADYAAPEGSSNPQLA